LPTNRHLVVAGRVEGAGFVTGEQWLAPVRAAERAGVTFVTLEDSNWPATGDQGAPLARLDAIMAAAWLGPRTHSIGLVPAAATTTSEPFLLSTQIATLDYVSRGRGGWLAEIPDLPGEGGYVGPRPLASGSGAFAEAAEHVEIVRRLWDSWEDDAEIRDAASHRFIDRERIHHIDFDGRHMSVKGPSITPRPPQGQPPVLARIAARPELELMFAAANADVVLVAPDEPVEAEGVRTAVAAAGRDPAAVRVLLDIEAGAVAEAEQLVADGGYDGVRLLTGEPGALAGLATESAAATLRERLGLERPANRYAAAPRGVAA
jgi:alkanesulfonate monooxygenase SsuD/methylene tetrahydromethanopterin reductase-like flavin-dependent oxidoreductase (luciferase family)